jgi:DNA polymerase-3 subunit alpha
VDDFIKRKQGKIPIAYEIPELKDILEETYGVIVYQEQVMKIASKLASFTLADADILRRAMGKKKADEMAMQKKNFLEGAQKNKIPAKKAERLFDLMAKFAEYGFNKSHSAAYALIAYQTAYLKANYPAEYITALLISNTGLPEKVASAVGECRRLGITVLPPDINRSQVNFSIEKLDSQPSAIRFGLATIKNIGVGAVEPIIAERSKGGEFKSIEDFCRRATCAGAGKAPHDLERRRGGRDAVGGAGHIYDGACRRRKAGGCVAGRQRERLAL